MIPSAARLFISATGTDAGKTFFTRGLARLAQQAGARVAALKPIETGVDHDPRDALALAAACARPELAHAAGFYRSRPPLAPYAASLETASPPPDLPGLARAVRTAAAGSQIVLVEGAGGLLVPLDRDRSIADLVHALAYPLVLVAPDELGVLSAVLTCTEAASTRRLPLAAVILSQRPARTEDPSPRTNLRILHERLPCPVLRFPVCPDDDDALAAAAHACGALATLAPLASDLPE